MEKCLGDGGLDSLGVFFPLKGSGFLPTNTKISEALTRCVGAECSISSREGFPRSGRSLALLFNICFQDDIDQ